jgi:hypothetical protein
VTVYLDRFLFSSAVLQYFKENAGCDLKLGHDHFLSILYSSLFIHNSAFHATFSDLLTVVKWAAD